MSTVTAYAPSMNHFVRRYSLLVLTCLWACLVPGARAASLVISGELKQWHKITITLEGPQAAEMDNDPNPFTDYRLTLVLAHESGSPTYRIPGYFAADGDAANTSAALGNKWRAHFSPDKPGKWTYSVSFVKGRKVAVEDSAGQPVPECDGLSGSFSIDPTDKVTPDLRSKGRLQVVQQRYLRFAGTGEYFLKAGPDSPENMLAYADFDGTYNAKKQGTLRPGEAASTSLKTWERHIRDWKPGDPTWKGARGKGLIGALNYLSAKGCNAFSFLTYNAGGDGDDVWPFVERDQKMHYDCSKLDQWQIVFDHATKVGLFCHFKTQETENDDRQGPGAQQSLDGGDLGPERKLYYRELIARFGYLLALNWNLGEENTQSPQQLGAAAAFFYETDPFRHLVVVHSYPDKQDQVYVPLLGKGTLLTGASLQNGWDNAHQRVLKWLTESEKAGRIWVVANDEQNPASLGVPPDPGYQGFSGLAREKEGDKPYNLHDIRRCTLWGTLLAGGQGVEYYFGYTLPENDLKCEDFRSRDKSWDYCRIALGFFRTHKIPFWEMRNADELTGNPKSNNSAYCLAKPGEIYVLYSPEGRSLELDLTGTTGKFRVQWFDPRNGGGLENGAQLEGGKKVRTGSPPKDSDQDWVILISRLRTS